MTACPSRPSEVSRAAGVGAWLVGISDGLVVTHILDRTGQLDPTAPWIGATLIALASGVLAMKVAQQRPRPSGLGRYLPLLRYTGAALFFLIAVDGLNPGLGTL